MDTKTLLERYAELLISSAVKDIGEHKPKGPSGFWKKEWTQVEIDDYCNKQDDLEGEYRGVVSLNWDASPEHKANIILAIHRRGKIPDVCWEYMTSKMIFLKEVIDDERELFSRVNENDWWVRRRIYRKIVEYERHRSKVQSRVKVNMRGEVQ